MGKEREVNGRTIGKRVQKMAKKSGLPLKSIKHATGYLRRFDGFMLENHPTQTLELTISEKTP